MAEPIMDFSKTRRVVLLVDLTPLLLHQHPNYLTSILTTTKRLLSFPPLSSSLFAFKLFFSSLSPLLSSSLLPSPHHSSSLSFNHPSQILSSLSNSLSSLFIPTPFDNSSPSAATCVATSLMRIAHDYAWEFDTSESNHGDFCCWIRSNLVIVLSSCPKLLKHLYEFVGVDLNDEDLDEFVVAKFREIFCGVNDAFVNRDIHFSWIDVKCEIESNGEKGGMFESQMQFSLLFDKGIRSLGWGFCSTDLINLGSAVIPFGLIYPKIGISFDFVKCCNDLNKNISAQLSLEIKDVNGKPLECKVCDLELLNLNMLSRVSLDNTINALKFRDLEGEGFDCNEKLCGSFGDGPLKMHVKEMHKYDEGDKIEGCSRDYVLVRGFSRECGKSRKNCSDEFFADRALEIVSREMGFQKKNSMPLWQIFLSFLYKEGYCPLVSLSNGKGDPFMGILKPLTAHLSILVIIDKGDFSTHDFGGSNLANTSFGMKNSKSVVNSQTGASPSGNCVPQGDVKRKKNKEHMQLDLTWSSFHNAASECSDFDLVEIYFSRELNNSKKLKFLKCWMKQAKKSSRDPLMATHGQDHTANEIDARLNGTNQEKEQLMSLHFSSEPCRMQEGAASVSCLRTAEAFFGDLPTKIEQSLGSGVDLQTLAEHLVTSSIYWLTQKHEMDNNVEGRTTMVKLESSYGKIVVAELIKLLLREPKELKEKRKSQNIVREYELQIFVRMELLRSEVAENIEESTKQKLVRQICSLLEIIQYLVEGGFHSHISLHEYVERTIKTRYSHILEGVVHRIYIEMDLLLFRDETEPPSILFNSEDSNQSWRDKQERHEMAESTKIHQSVSAEDDFSPPPEDNESPQGIRREEHARKLSEARERRERSRRFVSFTSWKPDLQRVWAPKQTKAMKVKSESLQKESKRKERTKAGYKVVCETPMTGKRRSCSIESSIKDQEQDDHGSNSSTSVSKALFQDD